MGLSDIVGTIYRKLMNISKSSDTSGAKFNKEFNEHHNLAVKYFNEGPPRWGDSETAGMNALKDLMKIKNFDYNKYKKEIGNILYIFIKVRILPDSPIYWEGDAKKAMLREQKNYCSTLIGEYNFHLGDNFKKGLLLRINGNNATITL